MWQIWKKVNPRMGIQMATTMARRHLAKAQDHNNSNMWKKLTFMVATPAIGLCMVNAFVVPHKKVEPEPFVKYEHLRRRTKRFPWGDGNRSLFHNAKLNALPDGYEHQ
ncbi:cytochrome c oxidase subunit 6A, mitochondrial [Drosophila tropicalis]|uniref:cytochrome c oxidase subunit 6A, mitochondrial n=1 Tax=Drosophila tropicalis TaxID=46794 RepID=UPI0035ABFC24